MVEEEGGGGGGGGRGGGGGGWGGVIPGLGGGRIDSARDECPSPLASGWRGGWGGGVEGVAVLMYLRAWPIMPALSQKGTTNSVNLKRGMQCLTLVAHVTVNELLLTV